MIYELWNLLTSFGEDKIKEITKPSFGSHLLDQFGFEKKFINVNHGDHGATPKSVLEKLRKYREEMESNPDRWFNYTLIDRIKETKKVIGEYLNVNSENILMLNEKTEGIKEICENIISKPNEKILTLNISNIMAKSKLEKLKKSKEIQIVELSLTEEDINSDDEKFLNKIERLIKQNQPIKVAFFEQISSAPSLNLPIEKIIKLLNHLKIISIIDGSQAVGQISLDISILNPDFYVTNFHNWSFAPKSTAMVFMKEKQKELFKDNFQYEAENIFDFSACLVVKDAIRFIKSHDEIEIRKYIRRLAWEAGKKVTQLWNTEVLIKNSDRAVAMVNVRIPCDDITIINLAAKKTLEEFNIFIFCFHFDGKYYAKFTAQIYNEVDDFIYAGKVFLKVLNEFIEIS